MKQAKAVRLRIENLVNARLTNMPADRETVVWLSGVDRRLYARLARVGLAGLRHGITLGQLVKMWLERRAKTLAPQTMLRLRQSSKSLLEHFGADRAIEAVSEGDVEDYRAALLSQGLAEATVRKRCSDARAGGTYMKQEVKSTLCAGTPFLTS